MGEDIKDRVERKSNVILVWILSLIIVFVLIIILILVKINKPEISLLKIFFWGIGFVIVIGGIAGGYNIYRVYYGKKFDILEEKDLPLAIRTEDARLRAVDMIKDQYYDYIEIADLDGSARFGKSKKTSIYTLAGKGLYAKPTQYYVAIVNQHYPDSESFVFLASGFKDARISKYQNLLSIDPEDEPDVEEIVTENPFTGTRQVIKKKGKTKEEKKEKEKAKEAL